MNRRITNDNTQTNLNGGNGLNTFFTRLEAVWWSKCLKGEASGIVDKRIPTAYLATSVPQAGIIHLGSDADQFKSGDNIRSGIIPLAEKCDVVFKEIVLEIGEIFHHWWWHVCNPWIPSSSFTSYSAAPVCCWRHSRITFRSSCFCTHFAAKERQFEGTMSSDDRAKTDDSARGCGAWNCVA